MKPILAVLCLVALLCIAAPASAACDCQSSGVCSCASCDCGPFKLAAQGNCEGGVCRRPAAAPGKVFSRAKATKRMGLVARLRARRAR